ncbi:MAG: tetratricopeptide repeat protein [Bryobacteraceae bacterium]
MSRAKAAGIAAVVALALGVLPWLGLRRKDGGAAGGTAAPAPMTAPQSPAHERAALEELLRKKPGHGPILLRLAQLDLAEGKPADARRRLEAYLEKTPGDAAALLELGRACYEAGDTECASRSTHRALELEPGNPEALYNLGAIHANQGRTDLARNYWRRAMDADAASDGGRKAAEALRQLGVPTRK